MMAAVLDEVRQKLKTKKTDAGEDNYLLELWTEALQGYSDYKVLSIEEGERASNDAGKTDAGSNRSPETPDDAKVSGDLASPDERQTGQ